MGGNECGLETVQKILVGRIAEDGVHSLRGIWRQGYPGSKLVGTQSQEQLAQGA
jgi:hypothetical protein